MGSAIGVLRATEREIIVYQRIWKANAFSIFASPILMLVAMGVVLGRLVDDNASGLDGLDYLVFLTPGLLVAGAMQTGSGYSLWPIMAGHRWLGFHRAMVTAPIDPVDVLSGHLIWVALRAMVAAAVFLGAGAALGGVPSFWGLLTIPICGLVALAFAAPLSAWAAHTEMDHSFDPLMRVGITPIMLFSGTFFPLEQLPVVLEWFARVFPLWHGVELARGATTGVGTAASTFIHLAVLVAYTAIGWLWGRRTFETRLTS